MADKPLEIKEIPLTGKLITAVDPATIDTNFQSLKNLRYTSTNLRGISGMSKINTTALSSYSKVRSGIHFTKETPSETHVLVQAYNSGETASQILQNTVDIPNQGDFSGTALHTDASGAGRGHFENVSQGQVTYCNGVESMIWGGDEYRAARFLNGDSGMTVILDYSNEVSTTSTEALNIATLSQDYIYIGSTLPLQGFKLTVGTVNTTSATMVVKYWTGSTWSSDILGADNTVSGGVPLAQTGTVTFSSDTESTAKTRMINGNILYWYQVYVANMDNTTTVTYCTVDASFQSIKDIWDGGDRTVLAALVQKATAGAAKADYTVNVFEENYNTAVTSTYADYGNLLTSDSIYFGFSEQMAGIFVNVAYDNENTTGSASVAYWNGSAWISVGALQDTTKVGGVSFAESGAITWTPPARTLEHKTILGKALPLYFYKVTFSASTTGGARFTYIAGISAQKDIPGYTFPIYAHNRVWLCSNKKGDRNSAICSSSNTTSVFNGNDTTELFFGDETALTAGTALYSQFGSSLYNIVIFCKLHETWILSGSGPEDWVQYKAANNIGCAAHLTMQRINLGFEPQAGQNRYVAIWQASEGIYIFDGKNFRPIHGDISNYFDHQDVNSINEDKLKDSVAFFDENNLEYHWLFANGSSTTLNKELVYNLRYQKWYEIDRNTGKALQFGFTVTEDSGDRINYGTIDTGYMERLENGTAFDGSDIVHELHTGDMALAKNSITTQTELRNIKLIAIAKSTTTNDITLTHYGDSSTTGTSYTDLSTSNSGFRLIDVTRSLGSGPRTFHSIKFNMTTNDETIGFEPLFIGLAYKTVRLNLR